MRWVVEGPLACFDTESTGTDVESDRIVTATVGTLQPGTPWKVDTKSYLIDPGVEIPDEAVEVHGITAAQAKEHGQPPDHVLPLIAHDLARVFLARIPVIGMNVTYDFTLLDRELRRWDLPTLEERIGAQIAPVVDVIVLDKWLDPFRKGRRKLVDLCEHYGVRIDGAHDSAFDALAATRVAYRIAWLSQLDDNTFRSIPVERRFPGLDRLWHKEVRARYQEIAGLTAMQLHVRQQEWRAEQAASLRDYFNRNGIAHDGVPEDWPMIPFLTSTDEAELAAASSVDGEAGDGQ